MTVTTDRKPDTARKIAAQLKATSACATAYNLSFAFKPAAMPVRRPLRGR
jgi:hypothetical protein